MTDRRTLRFLSFVAAFILWASAAATQTAESVDDIIGQVHSTGSFRSLVRDPATKEYLAPTYRLLAEQLRNAQKRVSELPFDDSGLTAPLNFSPYPPLAVSLMQSYRSRIIVILDSGVMEDHPLLEGRLLEVHDFTGEGGGDDCGHGTVQTIRHAFFEPRAQFLILKVARRDCRIPLSALLRALRFLKDRQDYGLVYMAGGIDITTNPDGRIACRRAEEIVAQPGMDSGQFIATTGNAGSDATWCPAAADGVTAVQVFDVDTYESSFGKTGGSGILQKGPYSSFPEITPVPIGVFYINYGWMFLDNGNLDVARDYARRAAGYPDAAIPALRLEAAAQFRAGAWDAAAETLRNGRARHPDSAVLAAELAAVLYQRRDFAGAEPLVEEALASLPDNHELLKLKAQLLEARGDLDGALAHFDRAATGDMTNFADLVAFGGRRFYRDDFARAIAANHAAERIDPTFGAAAYNIAIAQTLSGDTEAGRKTLQRYDADATTFLLSRDLPDPAAVTAIMTDGSEFQRHYALRYHEAADRRHAAHFATLAGLLAGSDGALKAALKDQPPEQLDHLIAAALDWAAGLTARNGSVDLTPPRRILAGLFDTPDLQRSQHTQAALASGLGRIHQRLGTFTDAADWYEKAGNLLWDVRARDAEQALFRASVAALDAGDLARAEKLQDRGLERSVEIYSDDQGNVILTALTPGLLASQALLALKRGDPEKANDLAERSYLRDHTQLFNGVALVAARIAAGREQEADELLGHMIRGILDDEDRLDDLAGLFRDHPSLEIRYRNQEVLAGVIDYARNALAHSRVRLTPAVTYAFGNFFDADNQGWAYPFGECVEDRPERPEAQNLVVVVGTGLLRDHPCLDGSTVETYDFAGGDGIDRNGATTAQTMYLVQLGSASYQIVSLRVLGEGAQGSTDALTRAFAAISVIRPDLAMTHIETNVHDRHMVGLARRAATRTLITAQAPEKGAGTVFPMMLSDDILVAR